VSDRERERETDGEKRVGRVGGPRSPIRPAYQIVLGGEAAERLDEQIGDRSGQGRF